ncbi:hypothetical protein [Rhodococcus sp. I2R]|uniref:hypothetical protein n=1 Tax=Rhodococcus sp. I2R TaxID=2855445 RepID=UPI001E4B0836|nr:hypothetical protein [Rhodococcus sp. I2R]MCC8926708.1 hypothetical protein [Rhodococcus sp. I2R]
MTTGPVAGQHSTTTPPQRVARPVGAGEDEAGRPVWALLGLLAAVSVALFIIVLGFSAA